MRSEILDATMVGIHNIRIPVTDLDRSFEWYQRVFGFQLVMEFMNEGERNGLVIAHPSGARLILMIDASRAAAMQGFDPIAFGVSDLAAIEAWGERLNRLDIEHPGVHRGHLGWAITQIKDPDGIEIRIYTEE